MAKKVNSSSQNRTELWKVIPLSMPFAVHIFPSYFCNFKCAYCIHSLNEKAFTGILKKQMMSMDIFRQAIDGMREYQGKLKLLNFAGHGEPLLNKDLPQMIYYARQANITDKIEVVTNAYNLTEYVSDALIHAGLDSIRISVQGVSAEKYKKISQVDIDYTNFVKQIQYFYRNKQRCKVYIKIIDHALENEDEKQKYYETFGGICDYIAVEHLVPTASDVDYEQFGIDYNQTQQGFLYKIIEVCPMPFYMLIIEPNGDVRNCCATKFPILLGNVKDTSLKDIWNSNLLKKFWVMHLSEGRSAHPVCNSCNNPDFGVQPGDVIDPYKNLILEKIK